jgi:hypothetical protein
VSVVRKRGETAAPREIDLGRAVVLPGLVNAHTHLELCHLREEIPAGTTFVSATGGPTVAGQLVTWNLGNLSNASGNNSGTVTVTVSMAADGTYTTQAVFTYLVGNTKFTVDSNTTSTIRNTVPPTAPGRSGVQTFGAQTIRRACPCGRRRRTPDRW